MITRPLILLLVLANSARGELLLKGIMMNEGQPLFSIYSTEDQTSKWIRIGQSFAEFKATEFDAVSDTLTVQNGDVRRGLKLQSSTIKVSAEDRRAMLIAQKRSVLHEIDGINTRFVQINSVRPESSDSKSTEEIAALTKRKAELDATYLEIDRAMTELSRADISFVQKLSPPPAPSK